MTVRRLDTGGRIDRSRPLGFTWDGMRLGGFAGDTLASALLACGQKVVGRSFKYHRPRGIMSAGVEESGAIVSIGRGAHREPNVKATMQELRDGLEAWGQNAWPNVRFDLAAVNGVFGRFLGAGFYYKTFMGLPPFEWGRGTGIWMRYEKLIRRAAGMGAAARAPDPDAYEHAHAFCDVLVVGAGPAGLRAALTAAEAGRDVILVEQDFEPGGDLLNDPAAEEHRRALVEAVRRAGVRLMTRTTAFGLYDHGVAGLVERVTDHLAAPDPHLPRQRFWTLRSAATVLATGAIERTIAFRDNDRPGVMTANAARAYLNRFGVLPGQRIVVATNNDSAYRTAGDLAASGAEVMLADLRFAGHCDVPAGVTLQTGVAPLAVTGRAAVRGVRLAARCDGLWTPVGDMACDLLLVSAGWSPVINLASHRGAAPEWNAGLGCFLSGPMREPIFMAGAAAGVLDGDACEASGEGAARQAMGLPAPHPASRTAQDPLPQIYEVRLPGERAKAFVDPQHDVTGDDVRLAHREGFVSVEHLKRYTTLGMATDQGKVGNLIGLALMAEALGRDIPAVGTTRFRPPYTPVAIGALAGRHVGGHFKPTRRTPLHAWNLRQGATMIEAGLWQRSWYFPRDGEDCAAAARREAATVRRTVGICDVSSLGKIAVAGPDAAAFLDRVYCNGFATLPVGKARYGVMLRDDGIVMDDGTTWRLSDHDFLMTTTTVNAGRVLSWLEELLQLRWPDLRVQVSSLTDQWAGLAIAGPESRAVLAECLEDAAAVGPGALPFMGVKRLGFPGGFECLIARISFSGELGYELYVPSGHAEAAAQRLWDSARARGGCLYGLEALDVLRIEKGHVTGAELDGRMTLDDAGLGRMASTKKPFIGSALRNRPELRRTDRPRLVGILPKDHGQRFNGGAILCAGDKVSGFGEGWVTAATFSPALGHWIGLGYVTGGHEAWQDRPLVAADPVRRGNVAVEVVAPQMFDPEGKRIHG